MPAAWASHREADASGAVAAAANAIVALALGGAPRPGRLALTDRDSGAIVDRRSDRDALGVCHRHRQPPPRDPHP
jgi:hypothetical protein